MAFDPSKFTNLKKERYKKYLKSLDFETSSIEKTVASAFLNLTKKNQNPLLSMVNLNQVKHQ